MKTSSSLFVLLAAALAASTAVLHAADPVVTNVVSAQRAGTKLVDITFNVSDADSNTLAMSVEVSDNNGTTFAIPVTALSGDLNVAATPTPAAKALVWDAAVNFNHQFKSTMVVRVIANDGAQPAGMALIPAGPFEMGHAINAAPVHTVTLSAFYMDKLEVSKALWDGVKTYADANGYTFSATAGSAFPYLGGLHPVTANWFDAVKWCNARSQKEGLTPVYYTDTAFTTVYKTGEFPVNFSIQPPYAKWSANGYRLPTEAEWEKAARGTLVGKDYPWGDTISPGDANYTIFDGVNYVRLSPWVGIADPPTTPVGFYDGGQLPPAGPNRANGYGLHDIIGNVREWCWDLYDYDTYYAISPANDPRGPATSDHRIARSSNATTTGGGSVWGRSPTPPTFAGFGFRCARGL
ncbi:MAG: SUMF1/EgtB/PvdO family nonheme iron enzyme [Verrucomicrobiaceae bacterium]|nr:SUMF1/EgtB/PvdO family nonheme iron enzyme [Verrucomicrobiaceae bacterium]